MGFSVEEIITNGSRTQEFMNFIMEMAEQQFHMQFSMGVRTVQVEYRSDRSLMLTFSEHPAEEVLGSLREMIGAILGAMTPEKLDELREMIEADDEEDDEVYVALGFANIEEAVRFAKRIDVQGVGVEDSELLREKDRVYLMLYIEHREDEDDGNLVSFGLLAEEFGVEIEDGLQRRAYLHEHGKVIIKKNALEALQAL